MIINKKGIAAFAVIAAMLFAVSCGKKDAANDNERGDISRPAASEKADKSEDKKENVPAEAENTEQNTEQNTDTKNSETSAKAEQPVQNTPAPTKQEAPKQQEASVSLANVRSKMMSECGISDAMPIETAGLANLYGIQPSQVKQSAGFVTMSGTFPHEIIMVEANDSASADNIASHLQSRLTEVLNQSKSYDADNYALAQQCRVTRNGNFVALFLSPSHSALSAVYGRYVK